MGSVHGEARYLAPVPEYYDGQAAGDRLCLILTCLVQLDSESLIYGALPGALGWYSEKVRRAKVQ
jgi:hypothetical protein